MENQGNKIEDILIQSINAITELIVINKKLVDYISEDKDCKDDADRGFFLLPYEDVPDDIRVDYNEVSVTIEQKDIDHITMTHDQVKEFIQKITPKLK